MPRTLDVTLRSQGTEAENSEPGRTCACVLTKSHHGRKSRLVMTQAGKVRVSRVYRCCVKCPVGLNARDGRLGIDGRYSPQARRLISLAGVSWPYDLSSAYLLDFCGLSVNDTPIREIAPETGAKTLKW